MSPSSKKQRPVSLDDLEWIKARATAHIQVDGQPMAANEEREVNFKDGNTRGLFGAGLLVATDEVATELLPAAKQVGAPGGCGCGG